MQYRGFIGFFVICLMVAGLVFPAQHVWAQDWDWPAAPDQEYIPDPPPALESLMLQGAQIRYLGQEFGLDGWLALKGGRPQVLYATPDGKAIISGLLFGADGSNVTARQLARVRLSEEAVMSAFSKLSALDQKQAGQAQKETAQAARDSKKTPGTSAEQLFFDVENANWVVIGDGSSSVPFIYAFVDPQCPHCHEQMQALAPYIAEGKISVRLIPVGWNQESAKMGAYLLASENPYDLWQKHLGGDNAALSISGDVNTLGVARNMKVMTDWGIDATPFIVYRSGDGKIKLVRGMANDTAALVADVLSKSDNVNLGDHVDQTQTSGR